MGNGKTYRVIQWATGNIGTRSLRTVIQHPRMKLVGLYVSSPDKVGKDAGALCGLGPVGVSATNSVDEIAALDADCVLYMRQGVDFDEVCRLLASGKNIVTTRGEFHHPRSLDSAARRRVEEACQAGRTSIYSTGSSPGFITEALTLPLISLERRLDCLTIDEFANLSRRDSPDMIFNIMGYGAAPGVFDQRKLDYIHRDFAGTLSQIADAIGQPFDSTEVKGEMAAARNKTQIAAGSIEKGTVAALRITVTGVRNGKPLLRFRANWYCVEDIDAAWELEETGWRVRVEGDTPLDIRIRFPVPLEDYPLVMPGLTAHRAVNSVIAVCEAKPGIRTTVDLPQVIAAF
jgi:2,4-diaminopentanoate dehydrogenase